MSKDTYLYASIYLERVYTAYIPHTSLDEEYLKEALRRYDCLLEDPQLHKNDPDLYLTIVYGQKLIPGKSLIKNGKTLDVLKYTVFPCLREFRIRGEAIFRA